MLELDQTKVTKYPVFNLILSQRNTMSSTKIPQAVSRFRICAVHGLGGSDKNARQQDLTCMTADKESVHTALQCEGL